MPDQSDNIFIQHLQQLLDFKKQDQQLNVEEFEKWKSNLLEDLNGNYKVKVKKLEFYTIQEESHYDNDDLPF
jgi:hypothetical protein